MGKLRLLQQKRWRVLRAVEDSQMCWEVEMSELGDPIGRVMCKKVGATVTPRFLARGQGWMVALFTGTGNTGVDLRKETMDLVLAK